MELRDFFEDDDMRILKPEFRGAERNEFDKWIDEHRSGNVISSAEFKKELLEEKAKRHAEKQSNP